MADTLKYFLGVEGEQVGPLSEEQLLDRIRNGLISPDSLIWWEGQSDWETITNVEKFKNEFVITSQTNASSQTPLGAVFEPPPPKSSTPPTSIAHPSSPLPVNPSPPNPQRFISFAEKGTDLAPIFKPEEAKVATELVLPKKVLIMIGVFLVLSFGTWAFFQFRSTAEPTSTKQAKAKVNKENVLAQRKRQMAEAEMGILLNPSKSLQIMTQLFTSNPKDEVGQEASKALLNYYTKNKLYDLAGNVLLKLEKPSEAAKMFLQDPKLSGEAEKAFFQAFQTTTGKERADFLIQNIELLIRPIKNINLAKERILLFEKTFPNLPHPFTYYSLPVDQRIQNIFNRLSYTLVEQVIAHMKDEFPQITLVNKPTVEVKRNATGELRVIARYQGDLLLRTDKIKNIFFIFWWIDGQWILVDTNLTQERQNFAASMRKKYEAVVLSPTKMLDLLEREFSQIFPEQSLHEAPRPKQSLEKKLDD